MVDNRPNAVTTYEISMTLIQPDPVGSVRVLFCADYAVLTMPCGPPAGLDVSGATITSQSGISGFTIDPSTTANVLVLTRVPSAVTPGPVTITLSGVTNQSYEGSGFARMHTYASTNGTGTAIDEGALGYVVNDGFDISTEVPPYLAMCAAVTISSTDCSSVSGDYLELGEFSAQRPTIGQSQFVIATNADGGYGVYVNGQTMTSGNNVLPALTVPTVSRTGTSQFGINLRANTSPSGGAEPSGPGAGSPTADYNQANRFKFVNGELIASSSGVSDYRKYSVSYLVNISRDQPAGVYSSSYSYVGLGNF
jgi:hypothetical protein